jgi:hypothetical protein
VVENRVLRTILGSKGNEVTADWMKLLHDLYCSPNIIQVIKSRRMKWAEHVANMGQKRNEK